MDTPNEYGACAIRAELLMELHMYTYIVWHSTRAASAAILRPKSPPNQPCTRYLGENYA